MLIVYLLRCLQILISRNCLIPVRDNVNKNYEDFGKPDLDFLSVPICNFFYLVFKKASNILYSTSFTVIRSVKVSYIVSVHYRMRANQHSLHTLLNYQIFDGFLDPPFLTV